jgi:two-component system, OmpR family, response regulator RegX3
VALKQPGTPAQVLIVEDEPAIADALRYALEREGFSCRVVHDGRSALSALRELPADLVLLDLMLPEISGTDVCREIRRASDTAVIVISARDSETDKVLALEIGADDYMTKPFSAREVVARVRALLRRLGRESEPAASQVISIGPITLDPDTHEVRVDGVQVDMPPKEFALLELLMRRAGKLCTRDHLIADVWGPHYFGDTRTLDVHIRRLRAKLEPDQNNPRHLVTVRGLGYKFQS